MYGAGESEDAIVAWLRTESALIDDAADAIVEATGRETSEVLRMLTRSPAWNQGVTGYTLTTAAGTFLGNFTSARGRTLQVGDRINLPNAPEPPHKGEAGRGTVWRVVGVEDDEDPRITARLTLEPVRRLEPDA